MTTPLVCSFCRATYCVVLRDGPILPQLLELRCSTCHHTGALQLQRIPEPPPPPRVGKYDEPPDDLSDEELLEHRRRSFPTTPRR
jgi:hypothetical protein